MIQISLFNILQLVEPLREISKKNFSGANSFRIARLIRELDKEVSLFEESRREIAMKYSEKTEDGEVATVEGNIKIKEDYLAKCEEELIQLYDTIVEVNVDKLPMEAFDGVDLTPEQASLLLNIVEA